MTDNIIPAGYGEAEYIDKKSRFIGQVEHVESESEAMAFVERIRKKHADATHNVWAYVLSGGAMRWSDDGEPGGTSGQADAERFRQAGVCDVCCVVTRYFGGILLAPAGWCGRIQRPPPSRWRPRAARAWPSGSAWSSTAHTRSTSACAARWRARARRSRRAASANSSPSPP